MTDSTSKLRGLNYRFAALHKAAPSPMGAFQGLMGEASKAGKLSTGLKELVALALAVGKGCDDCILFHANQAKSHGISREELSEVLAICIEMGGGPGAVYAAKALAIFDEL
ncbi:MAG: carboxymuconolactone decarboxylase family protein [Pseudomonadota bacterium]